MGRAMKGAEPEKDYYSILGAEEESPRADIERRYKRLARRHHPDRGGDEEEMKNINEAWRVLGDADSRSAYDERRGERRRARYLEHTPASTPAAGADPLSGRIVGAGLCIFIGLVLMFLVRVHYVVFLWPLALLGLGVVGFGVLMAHGALAFAREAGGRTRPARGAVWAQELVFWGCVCGGAYGVYVALVAV
jgi:hypothetical protein